MPLSYGPAHPNVVTCFVNRLIEGLNPSGVIIKPTTGASPIADSMYIIGLPQFERQGRSWLGSLRGMDT